MGRDRVEPAFPGCLLRISARVGGERSGTQQLGSVSVDSWPENSGLFFTEKEAALEVNPGLEGAESSGQQACPGTWGWNAGNGKLA